VKITVLASNNPEFSHTGVNELVLASLIEGFSLNGHDVFWAVAGKEAVPISDKSKARIDKLGVKFIGDFTDYLSYKSSNNKIIKNINLVREVFLLNCDDIPVFTKPESVISKLQQTESDIYLLFWDTWFESLIPYMENLRVSGFLAKPRYDATRIRLKQGGLWFSKNNIVYNWLAKRILKNRKKCHLERISSLEQVFNICSVDVNYYKKEGVDAKYIPLPIFDFFSNSWEKRTFSYQNKKINIIASMGSMHALGSSIAIEYLDKEILPKMEQQCDTNSWVLNFYGRGGLPKSATNILNSKNVVFNGFVDDIDSEMLNSPIFLFLNNAGAYTGTYTRVSYALSSGICMIAHSNLKKSVPELKHRFNILMGSNAEEIVELIIEAINDQELRAEIGNNARSTYTSHFSSKSVGHEILKHY